MGPITETKIVVFVPVGSSITINDAADLQNYTFAVVRGGISSILLGSNRVPAMNMKQVNRFVLLPRLVDKGRVDLFAYEKSSAIGIMKRNDIAVSKYKDIFTLKTGELYYAFNLSVDPRTIQEYQKALETVKQNKEFIKKLTEQYLQ